MKSNRIAIVMALAGLMVFLPAVFLPCLYAVEFGRERAVSLAGGIGILWRNGHAGLALLLFTFTILFPPLKLLGTIALASACVPLDMAQRSRAREWLVKSGKFSMLDVLVVAILVVSIKVRGHVSVAPAIGTYLFCTTILLSISAGLFLNLSGMTSSAAGPGQKRSSHWPEVILGVLGVALGLAGAVLFYRAPLGSVESVRVTKRGEVLELPRFGSPSYYVVVELTNRSITLDPHKSTPIGNGLTWILPQPAPMEGIRELRLFDKNFLRPDTLVDRVEISGWQAEGQKFSFQLEGPVANTRRGGLAALVIAGILVVASLGRFLFRTALTSTSSAWLAIMVWQGAGGEACAAPEQFILFNLSRGVRAEAFEEVQQLPSDRVQPGLAAIFSYLAQPREQTAERITAFLRLAEKTGTPVVVQLDGENWWGGRPDLWNWWDPSKPGYSEDNRLNVEWTSWSPQDAVKIAWRNWGRQLRVLPPPNLLSPQYREACRAEMKVLIPMVLDWWRQLPPEKQHLLVGIKLGWESSIGVNAWHYRGGNSYIDKPADADPVTGIVGDAVLDRGVAQMGYAAVSQAGLRKGGEIIEADLAEVVRRHLADMCELAAELGVPRDRLFTHAGGWKEGEALYQSAVNPFSCPGWSFYRHASDPRRDTGVQQALKQSDAPHWAAVEWLYQGPNEVQAWKRALEATLADPRCRYLCIYNWEAVRQVPAAMEAVRSMGEPARGR